MLQTHGRVSPLSAVQQLGAVRAEGVFRGMDFPAVVLLVVSFIAILFFPPIFFLNLYLG